MAGRLSRRGRGSGASASDQINAPDMSPLHTDCSDAARTRQTRVPSSCTHAAVGSPYHGVVNSCEFV
eukprot:100733-Pleurochrysis_carterae.AAC.1